MAQNQVEELLNARAEIDEQLRRHKNLLTVLFTDVVGSTSYFERFGDTAGLAMVHLNAGLGTAAVTEFGGTVVKTIGDSVMAEFPSPVAAVGAAVEMQRRLVKMNSRMPEHKQMAIRIGIHSGMGFRKGTDVFGDVVNLAARITKRTEAAQILISRPVQDAIGVGTDFSCRWLDKCTIDGRSEKEDIFEVIWTNVDAYNELRRKLSASQHSAEAHTKKVSVQASLPARYQVLEKVGQGGVGIVYKVRDLETSEVLALKILKAEVASDPVVQANFSKELCLARKITHKNVCRIYDLYRSEETAYASMEYVHGDNLSKLLTVEGRIPVGKSLQILKQICAGLHEAHAQGVVHRDLKPANIMIDGSGVVKIMDFGIARLVEKETGQTGSITGTPAYMSPEQASGKPVDARTDIYALGLLLYEMVTGTPTFSGDTAVAIALRHITERPTAPRELNSDVPEEIEKVILKCLEKNPAKRFQSVSDLEAALAAATRPSTKSMKQKTPFAKILANSTRQWAGKFQNVANDWHIREKLNQRAAEISTFLQQPTPRYVTIGNRNFVVKHVVSAAGALSLVLVIAITAAGHSKKAAAPKLLPSAVVAPSGMSAMKDQPKPQTLPITPVSLIPTTSLAAPAIPPLATSNSKAADVEINVSATSPKKPRVIPSGKKVKAPPKPTLHLAIPVPTTVAPSTPMVANTLDVPETLNKPPSANTRDNIAGPNEIDTFFEVGSFKDAKWADDASDTLQKLGFQVHVSHKGHLWMNGYHVLVGPYRDPSALNAARLSLEADGYTPRPTR